MDRFVTISGCSGGGKSSLLDELGRRGHPTVEEPGRRIVAEELHRGGTALPWIDEVGFIRLVLERARLDRVAARDLQGRWVFFDRGLVDAVVALQHLTGEPILERFAGSERDHRWVFMAPPWPEIYVTDTGRRHSLDTGIAEYQRLVGAYPALGYEIVSLPRTGVSERADFVLQTLAG